MRRFPRTDMGWKIRALWGSFALDSWGMRAGKIISVVVILTFGVCAVFFFEAVFSNLLELEGIGEPLLWRVIGITFVTVFALLVVSNLITGIATLYRSNEISFLFSKPIPYNRVYVGRFVDNLAYSSWSLAVLGAPIVIAWGIVFEVSWGIIVAAIFFGLVPLVFIAAEIGSAILTGLVFLARKTSPRLAMLLVTLAVLASIAWAVQQRNRGLVVEGAARTSTVERYLASLSRENLVPVTPPHWLTGAMRALRRGDFRRAAFLAGLLTLTAAVWLRWLSVSSKRLYYSSWIAFEEITGRKTRSVNSKSAWRFTRSWIPNPLNAMLRKDLLQFLRNPSQWGQFLILIAFLLIYLLNLVYISSRLNFDNPYWKTMVLFLNFAFTGFILATLSVRFVYPLISLEGRGFWLIRKAPVSVSLLFWEKFFLAFVVFMGLCEMIVFFSNHVLHTTGAMMILTTAATFMMGAALTGLAIGMGALFPDFKDESPMRIASTPGGVLTVVISLIYVGIMVAILAWPAKGYFLYLVGRGQFPAGRALVALIGVVLVNALILLLPVKFGHRAIQTRDV
ncbi:MAG: hypothetical protein V2A61_05980 [Calditrichota bacterium]